MIVLGANAPEFAQGTGQTADVIVSVELAPGIGPRLDSISGSSGPNVGRGWLTCVLLGTSEVAANALDTTVGSRPLTQGVVAGDISQLPATAPGTAFSRPIAVSIPVRAEPLRWPVASDLLTRLPDAVWGTSAGGATDVSPAPGSAAAILGRTSRFLSSWPEETSSSAGTGGGSSSPLSSSSSFSGGVGTPGATGRRLRVIQPRMGMLPFADRRLDAVPQALTAHRVADRRLDSMGKALGSLDEGALSSARTSTG